MAEAKDAPKKRPTKAKVAAKPATSTATKKVAKKAVEKKTAKKDDQIVEPATEATTEAVAAADVKEAAAADETAVKEDASESAEITEVPEPVADKAAKKAPVKKATTTSSTKKSDVENTGGRGRKYFEAAKKVDREVQYSVDEAVKLAKETSTVKFDATVEIHLRLGLDPRNAEQNIRGTVKLPAGTGKTLKVLAFVPEAKAAAAKKAGADFIADDDTKKKIADGWSDFDVAVATPDQMTEVAKLGKVLGPKGLMPNPKAGTVSAKPEEAIAEVKKGTIEYRLAKDATIHAGIGKVSFTEADLAANLKAYFQAIMSAKPTDLKGTYVKSVAIASTMGPGIKVSPESLRA